MSAGEQVWRNPWLRAKLLTFRRNWTADDAAERGALMVFKELGDALPGYSKDTLNWAAADGHLAVVQWLHANRDEGCTAFAMNWAAENGHLAIVQWLHANRDEGCTRWAMTWAAGNGHIDVVKWLYANRREGCTTAAMLWAAGNGHLDVVKWLHAHFRVMQDPDVLSSALFRAERAGHVDSRDCISGWLQNKRPRVY